MFSLGSPVVIYMYFMNSKTGVLTSFWPFLDNSVAAQHWFASKITNSSTQLQTTVLLFSFSGLDSSRDVMILRKDTFLILKDMFQQSVLLSSSVEINTKYKVEFIMLHRMLISHNNKRKHDNA